MRIQSWIITIPKLGWLKCTSPQPRRSQGQCECLSTPSTRHSPSIQVWVLSGDSSPASHNRTLLYSFMRSASGRTFSIPISESLIEFMNGSTTGHDSENTEMHSLKEKSGRRVEHATTKLTYRAWELLY